MKFIFNDFMERVNHIGNLWEHELKQFVFADLADFSVVKEFVLERLK